MTNSADIYHPADGIAKYFIKSIWRLQEYNIFERTETILPKGTVEIIFNLSENITYCYSTSGIKTILPTCFINGINFKPFHLLKNGQQLFLGIQLNAIGLKVLFNVSIKEFHNNIIEMTQVSNSLNELYHQLFAQNTFEEQVAIIMKWIYLKISNSKYNKTIDKVHYLFYSQKLNYHTVSQLSDEVFLSDRHMRRLSSEWLGMSTESYILYNKYLSSLHLMHISDKSLTQIGLEAGYYDQSHFIREFKSYTNLTPKEYQASQKGLPGHIIR